MASLSREQLDQMRASIETEYQKDMEALQRLSRFLPNKGEEVAPGAETPAVESAAESENLGVAESQIDAVYRVVSKNYERNLTSRDVFKMLADEGFPMDDRKQALATIGTSLTKLATRGRIRLIRKGKGRQANIFRGHVPSFSANGAMVEAQRTLM